MGWKFWKSRADKTGVIETEDPQDARLTSATAAAAVAAPRTQPEDPDLPRLGAFHFDVDGALGATATELTAGLTSRNPVAVGTAEPDVRAVLRGKSRRSRRSLNPIAAGIRPVLVPSLREMAVLYREAARQRADRLDEAAAMWRAYLDLCPDDGAGWTALGQNLLAGQQREAAWGAFVEARTRLPDDPLPAGALGYLSELAGDLDGAITHYEAALERAPEDLPMLAELARLYGRAQRPADAQRIAERRAALQGGT